MGHEDHGGEQEQLEEHSLPGTNQAGKGPGSSETTNRENSPSSEGHDKEQLEEHSLPGTNQAGKGPGAMKRETHS